MIKILFALLVAALAVVIVAAVSQKFANFLQAVHEKFECIVDCAKNSQM